MATQLLMAKSPEEAIGAKNASAVFIAGGTEVNRLGSDAAAAADTLISLKKCAGLMQKKESGKCFVTILLCLPVVNLHRNKKTTT